MLLQLAGGPAATASASAALRAPAPEQPQRGWAPNSLCHEMQRLTPPQLTDAEFIDTWLANTPPIPSTTKFPLQARCF